MKTLVRIIIWTLVALAALTVAAVALTSTHWFQTLLRSRMTASLVRLTGGRVEIEGMRFHPLLIEVTMDRLTIHGLEPPGTLPLFAARGLVAQISPASLLRLQLGLRELSWKQAEISISTCPGCGVNFPGPHRVPAIGRAVRDLMSLSAETATLANTDIYWNGKELPFAASATQVAILLRQSAQGHYDGSLASSGIVLRGKFGTLPRLALSAQFNFTKSGARINALTWRLQGMAGSGNGSLVWEPAFRSQFRFTAFGEIAGLARWFHLGILQQGQMKIEGEGTYAEGALRVQGRARGSRFVFHSATFRPGPASFSFAYAAENHHLTLSDITLEVMKGLIRARAEVRLGGQLPRFVVRARVDRLDLAFLFQKLEAAIPGLETIHPAARLTGVFDGAWRGDFQNLGVRFDVALRPSGSQGMPLEGVLQGVAARMESMRIALKKANLKTPHSAILAHGTLGSARSPLSFQIVTTDFEEWRPFLEFMMQARLPVSLSLEAPARFSGRAAGRLGNIRLEGQLGTGRFRTSGWIWSSLDAEIRMNRDTLQVSEGRLRSGPSTLTFAGTAALQDWQLTDTSAVHLALAAERSPLGGLAAGMGIHFPLEADVSGKLSLLGTAQRLSGTGVVRFQNFRLGRESFPSASASIQVSGASWNFENIHIAQGPGLATGAASFDRSTRAFSARIAGQNFSLTDLIPHASRAARRAHPPIRGRVSFSLQGNGSLDHPNATAEIHIAGLSLYGDSVGDLGARINWQGKAMTALGFVRGAGGEIHFSGGAQASAEWPVMLAGTYQKLEIGPWIHLVSGSSIGASVAATGTFDLSGPLKDLGRLNARSEIAQLEIRVPPLSFKNDRPVTLHYSESTLRISPFHMKGPATDFSVEGSMRFGRRPSLALDLTGRADATLLSLLDPSLQATGGSQLKVHLGGTPAHPFLQGSMTIRDVSVSYSDLPIRLSGLNGSVRLQSDRAVISSLRGVIGGGEVSLSGYVTLQSLPRLEIRARLRQVRVRYPRDFTSVLGGGLVLAGTLQHAEVTGEVAVQNLFVSPNFNLLALIGGPNNHLPAAATAAAPSLASRIGLNIRVSSPQGVRLETRDVHLVADVDLHIQGTLADPVALGDVHARSGNAIFQGNRYTIARGDLSMNNPFRTEPILDLEAQTRVQRYNLTVEVSGPLDRLHVAYRSDPPLSTEDIVSLMALGYSRQAGQSGTAGPSNGALSSSVGASALLSEALSSQVGGRIQQLFGVSRIKINPEVNEPGVGTGPRVTVEQQLSPDFTVTYITNTSNSLYRVIRFEWDLSQGVSLVGMRDQNGIIGMELKFRRRFN